MNEIRMYVERLFQGKTLTDDVIELKEEIYGNLVARYEDYLAEGMSEADALEKTKASMTNVDDVLAGETGVSKDETLTTEVTGTSKLPVAASEAVNNGVPVNPTAATLAAAPNGSVSVPSSKKKWIIAAVVALLALGGVALGMAVMDELADAREDRIEAQRERQQNSSVSIDKNGVNVKNGDDEITIDSDGTIRLDGDLVDELLTEVVNGDGGKLQSYNNTDLSDGAAVEQAIRALPMSTHASDIDVTKGNGMLSLAYRDLPDYDGDSIDAALAYNVTALFCMIPGAQEIQVTVAEADDPMDEDYYVFQRATMEGPGGYDVVLNGAMLNESNWNGQIKRDHLYKNDFIDRMIERAERDWR